VLIGGEYIDLLVVSLDNGDHPLSRDDGRPWARVTLTVDDARELALQLQEAGRLMEEGQALTDEEDDTP